MKKIKWGLIGLGCLVVILIGTGYGYLKMTLPDYNGELAVNGLDDTVEILRDSYGMPHIYAKSDRDAYFALGYSMAQDRLFQMDMVRRAARGQLSEIMGADLVPVDKLFRTITAGRSFEEIMNRYPPRIINVLKAYTDGVNYYLRHRTEPLPIEFAILGYEPEPWKPSDGIAVHYYMAWDLNIAFGSEMLYASVINKVGAELAGEIFPVYPRGYPTIIPPGNTAFAFLKTLERARAILGTEGGGASNNWVISGRKSVTGKPILSNDPHLGHGMPGIWYEAHLVSPNMNVSGSVLPGMSVIVVGANEHVAWGVTNVMADDTDFYVETINPNNPDQYLFKGKWETMQTREETIKVKGGEDVHFAVKLTRHGPIIDTVNKYDEPSGTSISMRWTAYDRLEGLQAFYELNRARDIDDAEQAVSHFKCPGQNFVYADDQGNIGYWAAVAIPKREGFTGSLPLDGSSGRYEWQGYVPNSDQPHLRNPERGWIATANNKHVGDDYPYTISNFYAPPDRFVRIQQMLKAKEKLGVGDFEKMLGDFDVILAHEWMPFILENLSKAELTDNEKQALDILAGWDFQADADQVAPTVFHAFLNSLVKQVYRKRLGDDLYTLYIRQSYIVLNSLRELIRKKNTAWFDDPSTDRRETFDDVVVASYRDAIRGLQDEIGYQVEDWLWGTVHTLTLQHPFGRVSKLMGLFLNVGPFSIGGSLQTVNPQPYRFTNPWHVYHGASLRYVTDFADRKNSKRVIPAGISGNFMSPHYDDQVKLWRNGLFRPFVIDRESVEKDVEYRLLMKNSDS